MAIEPRRGCGYRKVGGLYMVCDGAGFSCQKLPQNLHICPVCGNGIKFSRGYTWVDPIALLGGHCGDTTCVFAKEVAPKVVSDDGKTIHQFGEVHIWPDCPFNQRRAGLLWVGARFYTPESFAYEANELGISKRVNSIPRGFVLGETWIFLAHKKAGRKELCKMMKNNSCQVDKSFCSGEDKDCPHFVPVIKEVPAVFYAFKPNRFELLIRQSDFDALTDEAKTAYEERHIRLIVVPDNDKDHQGTVYDEEEENESDKL